jgi:gamma-glutamyltranspeptidase/glutathione hydrolase
MTDLTFTSRRSPVFGQRGMVAASQPLAVAAGLEILAAGGSAADAAIAVAAALNVTEPTSTGLGGDCFCLYYDAASGQVSALNGSGRAPHGLTLERLRLEGLLDQPGDELPPYHAHTVTVPGACAGWCDTHARFGRLPLRQVLAPAVRLADEGFPVAPLTARSWAVGAKKQLASAPNGREMTIDGRAPQAGEIFRNPGLARTLRLIAEGGKQAFYEGPVAEAIVAVLQGAGGCMTVDDLAAHRSTWETPLSVTYRGVRVWECPPNGQGLTALLALNILESFDPSESAPLTVQRLHLQIEAMRLAFADTRWFVADPAFNPAPLDALLSKDYAAQRRAHIRLDRASLDFVHGAPVTHSDTVYFCTADQWGNACSFINSNYMGFGTGIVPQGWGFTLQNRGHNFSLEAGHPNQLEPGKRPYHTIIPGMATVPGESGREELYCAFGVMGGFMQPQGHVQVMAGMVDDGLDPQAALDAARFCIEDGTAGGRVALEEGLPVQVMAGLAALGHPVAPVAGWNRSLFGRGQIIRRLPQGVWCAASDPRADGCAMTD